MNIVEFLQVVNDVHGHVEMLLWQILWLNSVPLEWLLHQIESHARHDSIRKIVKVQPSEKKNYFDLASVEKGVFPELMIDYKDGVFRIAGQSDLVIKYGNEIWIKDWKTNKKLDDKSYFNSKTKKYKSMLYPLNGLMDCNLVHYQIQLSTYAWMIQKLNPEFIIKDLILVHFDHQGNQNIYHLDYLKKDVEKMLRWHKHQVIREK